MSAIIDYIKEKKVLILGFGREGQSTYNYIRKHLPQKELSVGGRLKNLSGAFRADKIPGNIRRVLLVDDIYTTGSTIEACTRVLKAAGVETIYFVVICMAGGR